MAKPDYEIIANRDADDPESPLVRIGAAWNSTGKRGRSYISGTIDTLPIGKFNGRIQLHSTHRDT